MEIQIKKLYDANGEYFGASSPSPIFGTSNGEVFVVYKPLQGNMPGFVIAELNDFEYDYFNNICSNISKGKRNINYNQIIPLVIKQGSIIFTDVTFLETNESEDQLLRRFLNNKKPTN